jgi:hypothetical protein
MSSSNKKKGKDCRPSRKDLVKDLHDLQIRLDRRKRKVKKLNQRLDALAKELRATLLVLGKRKAPGAASSPPLLTPLPTPPVQPSLSEIEVAAYQAYVDRIREGRGQNSEADWFLAESRLWKNIALKAHAEALRLAQHASDPEASGENPAVAK